MGDILTTETIGGVEVEIRRAGDGIYPLVIFSHGMGGYTCMGLAGAWGSWTRSEIRAVAALSPWHRPYLVQLRVDHMTNDQTLYQGGTRDIAITPQLIEPGGTYDQTSPAKYVQIFDQASHFSWTDGVLGQAFHDEMAYYINSFFDAYLQNGSVADLEVTKPQVSTLNYEHVGC